MAYTDARGGMRASQTQPLGSGSTFASTIVAALKTWRRRRIRRKILARLTPEQLQDIGQLDEGRPVLAIKAGLMPNLMSMR